MNNAKHIDDLNRTYEARRREWTALQDKLTNTNSELERVRQLRTITENQRAMMYSEGNIPEGLTTETQRAARIETLLGNMRSIQNQLAELGANAAAELDNIRRGANAEIAAELTAKPEAVDANATMLLNSGALTEADITSMANTYGDNPTMLKLIGAAAQKMGMTGLSVALQTWLSTEKRADILDTAVVELQRGFSQNAAFANVNNDYWTEKGYAQRKAEIAATDKV